MKKVFELSFGNLCLMLGYLVALAVAVYSSIYQGGFIDRLLNNKSFNASVVAELLIMTGLMVVAALLNMLFVQYLPLHKNLNEAIKCSIHSIKNILKLSQKSYESKEKGYYYNVATSSSFGYGDLYAQVNVELPGSIITILALVIIVAFVNPLFSLLYVVYIPVYLWLSKKPNDILSTQQSGCLKKQDATLNTMKDVIENKRIININRVDDYYGRRIEETSWSYNRYMQKFRLYQIIVANVPIILSRVLQVVTIGLSSYLYFKGHFTIGSIFVMYQFTQLLQEPIARCIQIWTWISVSKVHLQRLGELDASALEENSFERIYGQSSDLVTVTDGTFYADGQKDKKLFDADKIKIPKGGLTIIKGENGSGKSRFIDYITGYSDVESFEGQIHVGDEIKKASYLSYPVLVVDGDLDENMMGKKMDREVFDCLNITFDKKTIDSKVNNLSFGESQKLNLLRALSTEADVYFLDEPFTNLDKRTIKDLSEYIGRRKKDKSIVAIVHSNELDAYADLILTIREGKLISQEA